MNIHVGPQYWPEMFPAAGGQHQSPITIRSAQADFCQTLRDTPLIISYNAAMANQLTNTGHTAQVTVDGDDSSAYILYFRTPASCDCFYYNMIASTLEQATGDALAPLLWGKNFVALTNCHHSSSSHSANFLTLFCALI